MRQKYQYGYFEAPAYRGNGPWGWSVEASNMTVKDDNTVTIDLSKNDYVDKITENADIRFRIYNFGNQLYPNTSGEKISVSGSITENISNGSSDNYFSIDKPTYNYDHITITAAYNTSTSSWSVSADAYISKTANGTNAGEGLGYSTFGAETNVDLSKLPSGVTAQTATVNASGIITYNGATELAAGEGVLITNTTGNDVELSIPVKASVDAVSTNALRRVTNTTLSQTEDNYVHYILTKNTIDDDDDELGWYKVNNDKCTNLTIGTAYLRVDNTSASRGFFPLWSEDPTSLKAIASESVVDGPVYNMAGQRVNHAIKGLYIVNGKKVVK